MNRKDEIAMAKYHKPYEDCCWLQQANIDTQIEMEEKERGRKKQEKTGK